MTPEKNWLRGPKKSPMTKKMTIVWPIFLTGPMVPIHPVWSNGLTFVHFFPRCPVSVTPPQTEAFSDVNLFSPGIEYFVWMIVSTLAHLCDVKGYWACW